jgi:RNA polymerase sigma-70 factor (ECF subfamily)
MTKHSVVRPLERPLDAAWRPVALERLYHEQHRAVLRLFTRSRVASADAHDLTQEAFLRLSNSNALAAGTIGNAEGYLRMIARNLLRNRARAAKRHPETVLDDDDGMSATAPCEVSRLEARDSLNRLEAVIRAMKPKTREIFMAHRLDGMSYTEIAQKTGLSVSGIEKQMIKALAHINRHLDLD